jgi:hypothetical protein
MDILKIKHCKNPEFQVYTLQIPLLYHTSSNFKRAVVIRFTGHVDFVRINKIDKYNELNQVARNAIVSDYGKHGEITFKRLRAKTRVGNTQKTKI